MSDASPPDEIGRAGIAQGRAPRPWKATPQHWLIGTTHAAALAGFAARPDLWPWALGAIGATHVLGVAQSFNASSRLLGPVIARLPLSAAARGAVALTFDDGPDPAVTPRVLDILEAHRARATFFCIARRVREHASLAREIIARGHDVENHSFAHSSLLGLHGVRRLVREIGAAQAAIADATGVVPLYYRPPFGVRTPFTEPALAHHGLHCVGWNVRSYDTVDTDGARVAQRVLRQMQAGSIVLLHDAVSYRQPARPAPSSVLSALPRLLDALAARGGHAVALRAALA